MSNEISTNTVATGTESHGDGVGHSMSGSKGGAPASPKELELALAMSKQTIDALKKELDKERAKQAAGSDSSLIKELTEVLKTAVVSKGGGDPITNSSVDSINRSSQFKEFAETVNGRSLMARQEQLGMYKKERKFPINIPGSYKNVFGPYLALCVNGVHVSIPVDGKTYYINKTHYLHARERMAKVDRYNNTDIVKRSDVIEDPSEH